jgi:hypothetical protein
MVRLEGLGKLNKFNEFIRKRARDLSACSIVPELTTLQRAPIVLFKMLHEITLGLRKQSALTNVEIVLVFQ